MKPGLRHKGTNMNPIIIALLGVASLVDFGVFNSAKAFGNDLHIQFETLKLPRLTTSAIEFPVVLNVINPTNITMPLRSVFATISKKEGESWKLIGATQTDLQNISINANATTKLSFAVRVPILTAGTELLSFATGFCRAPTQEISFKDVFFMSPLLENHIAQLIFPLLIKRPYSNLGAQIIR